MKKSTFGYISEKTIKSKIAPTTIVLTCSLVLLTLGVATGALNHILFPVANAQLNDMKGLREEQRAVAIEKELETEQGQGQSGNAETGSKEFSLTLDRAHFIPLSPLSDSPGNQIKMMLHYSVLNPSASKDNTINAVMEEYAANQTLLRTSSLPEPIVLDDSDGTIQLATTFHDPNLTNVTARALLTDGQKINPLSDPIEASIGLGEVTPADIQDK